MPAQTPPMVNELEALILSVLRKLGASGKPLTDAAVRPALADVGVDLLEFEATKEPVQSMTLSARFRVDFDATAASR